MQLWPIDRPTSLTVSPHTPVEPGTPCSATMVRTNGVTGYFRVFSLRVSGEDWLADAHRPPAAAVPLVTAQPSLRAKGTSPILVPRLGTPPRWCLVTLQGAPPRPPPLYRESYKSPFGLERGGGGSASDSPCVESLPESPMGVVDT